MLYSCTIYQETCILLALSSLISLFQTVKRVAYIINIINKVNIINHDISTKRDEINLMKKT